MKKRTFFLTVLFALGAFICAIYGAAPVYAGQGGASGTAVAVPAGSSPQTVKKFFLDPTDMRVSFDFQNASVVDVIRMIAKVSDMNVLIGSDVKGTVTMKMKRVPLKDVLSVILEAYGLGMAKKNGIYYINSASSMKSIITSEKRASIETAVFKLPITPLVNTSKTSLGASTAGSTGSTGSTGGSSSVGGTLTENVANITSPFYTNILNTVKGILSKEGKLMYSSRYGILIVKDKAGNIELIRKYINSIKRNMTKAVFIKLKVIDVELSSGYVYGINWTTLYSDMGHYLGSASSLGISLGNAPTSNVNIPNVSADQITFSSGTGTNAVINALSSFGRIHIINQAKLEVLDGQTRTLNNMLNIPYLSGIQISSISATSGATIETPTIGNAESGIGVMFTPVIYHGKTYISVQLILNTVEGYSTYSAGGNTFTIPQISTKSSSFTIKVKNGKSALVGALQYKSITKNKQGVPLLSDIPLLGYLFSGVSYAKTNNELLLLITPVIER